MCIELTINQIGGLYNQLYNIEECLFSYNADKCFFNINSMFWSDIFEINNVKEMIEKLCKLDSVFSTKLLAVKNNPSIFMRTFTEAINNIKFQNLNSETCFKYLETLQIICYLHTYLYTSPFELSIYEGYKHEQFSAEQLKRKCMQKYCNPYYSFIKDKIISKINFKDLKILWIRGRPNISGFCLARMIKEKYPNVFIVSISNNSDFFSFTKSISLLKFNHALFSVFDCIVLNDNNRTYDEIKKCIIENSDLRKVDNIIYSPDRGNTIICSNNCITSSSDIIISEEEITMDKVINLKLFPINKCYWNKCSFCAINQKYILHNDHWNLDYPLKQLKKLSEVGINKFWALDEAIPIKVLEDLCDLLVKNKLHFSWHIRTRIEKDILSNNLPEKLSKCGLKHILFGFESAAHRILSLMNKTSDLDTYIELAEKIVSVFNNLKIYVHFPIIIGFPTESQRERNETFKFVDYLSNKYPYFSYNINILNLDISSHLYNHWEKYDISSIEYPCNPHDFIGNSVIWKTKQNPIDLNTLKIQAENQMKKQFNWYPNDALLDVTSFYTMWEYSRSQLNLKKEDKSNSNIVLRENQKIFLSDSTTLFQDEEGLYCLYNLENHQCIRGGQLIGDVVNEIRLNYSVKRIFEKYEKYHKSPIYKFVVDLLKYGFIHYID